MDQPHSPTCALVTGASSGLGEEYARQIAPHVEKLVLVARREAELIRLGEDLMAIHPGLVVLPYAADLTDPSEREDLVGNLVIRGFAPDLLVNNAGLGDYGEFVTADWARIRAMLDTNIAALTYLTHALLPGMIRQGRGAVIHVSSLASLIPIPDFAVYAATKAYVSSFSEALRIELKPHGIPVLAVCPGPVSTGFGTVARRGGNSRDLPGYGWFKTSPQQVVAESLAALEKGRARVYPGWKTAAAAVAFSVMPLVAIRLVMSLRPRRNKV